MTENMFVLTLQIINSLSWFQILYWKLFLPRNFEGIVLLFSELLLRWQVPFCFSVFYKDLSFFFCSSRVVGSSIFFPDVSKFHEYFSVGVFKFFSIIETQQASSNLEIIVFKFQEIFWRFFFFFFDSFSLHFFNFAFSKKTKYSE